MPKTKRKRLREREQHCQQPKKGGGRDRGDDNDGSERRLFADHMHSFLLRWGLKCINICHCCGDKEGTKTAFRRWYHVLRQDRHDEYPPLRHDTEVLMDRIDAVMAELSTIRKMTAATEAAAVSGHKTAGAKGAKKPVKRRRRASRFALGSGGIIL